MWGAASFSPFHRLPHLSVFFSLALTLACYIYEGQEKFSSAIKELRDGVLKATGDYWFSEGNYVSAATIKRASFSSWVLFAELPYYINKRRLKGRLHYCFCSSSERLLSVTATVSGQWGSLMRVCLLLLKGKLSSGCIQVAINSRPEKEKR